MSPVLAVWWWLHPDLMAVSQVVLGTLALAAGVAAIVYAWRVAKRQFEIMDEQGEVIDSQVKLLRDQTTLLSEHRELLARIEKIEDDQRAVLQKQGQIAERQAAILEEQHLFFQEQRDNKPVLELCVTGILQSGPATNLTFSVRNTGKAEARGFAWEIVVPEEATQCASFRTVDGAIPDVKSTTDFARQIRINVFMKDVHSGTLFVGDMVDVASIVVSARTFEPFEILWRIYADYGTVPRTGHNKIAVAPRPAGLLNVHPVLTIPAVS